PATDIRCVGAEGGVVAKVERRVTAQVGIHAGARMKTAGRWPGRHSHPSCCARLLAPDHSPLSKRRAPPRPGVGTITPGLFGAITAGFGDGNCATTGAGEPKRAASSRLSS